MNATYSQTVARGFEIAGYLLLAPTLLSLFYPAMFLIGGLVSRRAEIILYGLVPFLIVAPGLALLAGYYKHSRDRLAEKYVSALWIGTVFYNLLLLLPILYAIFSAASQSAVNYRRPEFVIPGMFVIGYLLAVYFGLKALLHEGFVGI